MAESVSIRLGLVGGKDVRAELKGIGSDGKAAFDGIGDAADANAKKVVRQYEAAAKGVETAQARMDRATMTMQAFAPSSRTNVGTRQEVVAPTGVVAFREAQQGLREMREEMARIDRQAIVIRNFLDPGAASAQRFKQEIRETKDVLRSGAITIDEYVARVRQLQAANGQAAGGMRQVGGVAGQTRAGMQQLSFQMNDVAVQFAAGTPPMQIFAQQSGQVIQAMQMMTNSTKGFLGFLGGPWGMALTSALVVATPFVAKLFEESKASKEATKEAKKHKEAMEALIDAQKESTNTARRSLALSAARLDLERQERAETVKSTIAILDKAKAVARLSQVSISDTFANAEEGFAATAQARRAQDNTALIEKQLADARSSLADATKSFSIANNRLIDDSSERDRTPEGRVTGRYEAARMKVLQGDGDAREVRLALDALKVTRDRELKAIADADKESKKKPPSLGAQVDTERAADLFAAAMKFRGQSETKDKTSLGALFSGAGISIDPEKTAWCAAFVNAVLAQKGMAGSGSLMARSFLGVGSATNKPTQGDLVVLKRGNNPAQGHVGFYEGEDAKGRINVLGGNTGNKVGTQAFDKSDVLGFRSLTGSSRDAAQEFRDMVSGLEALTGKFDPAAAAAKELADQLQRISAAEKQGLLAPGMADAFRLRAGRDAEAQQSEAGYARAGEALGTRIGEAPELIDPARVEALTKVAMQSVTDGMVASKAWINETSAAMLQLRDTGRSAIDAITDPQNWNDMGGLAKSIIQSIMRDLIQLAVANPLKNMLFGGDGSGKLLPTLFKGLLSAVGGAKGGGAGYSVGTFGGYQMPKFASGTESAPKGWALVGEQGPELRYNGGGERILNAERTRRAMATPSAPAGNTYHIDARGASAEAVTRLEIMMTRMDQSIESRAVGAVVEASARRFVTV